MTWEGKLDTGRVFSDAYQATLAAAPTFLALFVIQSTGICKQRLPFLPGRGIEMSRKKDVHTHLPVSQEDEAQAEHMLEQYHDIASDLHVSGSREQSAAALAAIMDMPEATQMALLKFLSKE